MINLKNILLEGKVHIGYPEIYYYDDNMKVIGYITYEEYENVPDIKFIHVDKDHRGKKIAYKMLKALQNEYPNEGIDFGYATESGGKFLKSLKFKTIINPNYKKIEKRLEVIKKKMKQEEKLKFPNGDLWNDLSDEKYEIEQELEYEWKVKKILK